MLDKVKVYLEHVPNLGQNLCGKRSEAFSRYLDERITFRECEKVICANFEGLFGVCLPKK